MSEEEKVTSSKSKEDKAEQPKQAKKTATKEKAAKPATAAPEKSEEVKAEKVEKKEETKSVAKTEVAASPSGNKAEAKAKPADAKAKKGNKKSKKQKAVVYKTSSEIPYHKLKVTCACGAEFDAGSTLENIRVDICSNCHPFFTGEKRIVDSEGRVEKFRKKYNLSAKS